MAGGFRNGAYATIWSIEDKGKYSQGRVTISFKTKDGEKPFYPANESGYETSFSDNFVNFAGTAHEMVKALDFSKRVRIRISSCDTTGGYKYTKSDGTEDYAPFRHTIFGFDLPDENGRFKRSDEEKSKPVKKSEPKQSYNNYPGDDDGGMPF